MNDKFILVFGRVTMGRMVYNSFFVLCNLSNNCNFDLTTPSHTLRRCGVMPLSKSRQNASYSLHVDGAVW